MAEQWTWVQFRQSGDGGWSRLERGGSVHVTGPADVSPVFFTYLGGVPRGDGARCGWCYLGATHSAEAHAVQLEAARRAEELELEGGAFLAYPDGGGEWIPDPEELEGDGCDVCGRRPAAGWLGPDVHACESCGGLELEAADR